jgi:acyl carrier protein
VVKVIVKAAGVSPDEPMTEETPMVGGGLSLDSVAVVELLVGIEKEFDIELPAEEMRRIEALSTVGTLAEFIESRLRAVG